MTRSLAAACLVALALACLLPGPASAQSQGQDARSLLASAEAKRFAEDWYGAIEDYLAAVAKNPSYSEALVGLAECYYALEEYDQALSYVRKAAPLRRGDSALQDLEGFVRIGLSDLAGAKALFTAVQASKPNDLDARFGLALLDLASGRKSEAKARLEDSLRLSPQNARALLSLALIAADQGRKDDAAGLIERALRFHGSDARVQFTAARLAAVSGEVDKAIFHARNAVQQNPAYAEARRLLGALLFGSGSVAEAIAIMQEGVAKDRKDPAAWYTLGLAQEAAGKPQDAIWSLRQALALKVDDEVARIALEDLVMDTTPLESPAREPYADWHFDRGTEFEDRSYFDAALVEYRRGLALSPDSKRGRVLYADLLRKRGLPGRQLAQLRFLDGIGGADTRVRDSIEALDSLLQDSVSRSWRVDQYALPKRHYRVAFFCASGGAAAGVTEGGHASFTPLMLRYLEDFLGASSRLEVLDLPAEVASPSEAFRRGREAGADYYVIFSAAESGRDVQLGAEIHVARTGSLAASHSAYRTGNDRIKEATSRLAGLIESSFAAKGVLLRRSQERGLVDLGSQDGLKVGDRLLILRKGELSILPEGLGPSWAKEAVVGELVVTAVDEELCEGSIKPSSFFDTVNSGDEVFPAPPQAAASGGTGAGAAGKAPAAPPASTATPAQPPLLFTAVRRLR